MVHHYRQINGILQVKVRNSLYKSNINQSCLTIFTATCSTFFFFFYNFHKFLFSCRSALRGNKIQKLDTTIFKEPADPKSMSVLISPAVGTPDSNSGLISTYKPFSDTSSQKSNESDHLYNSVPKETELHDNDMYSVLRKAGGEKDKTGGTVANDVEMVKQESGLQCSGGMQEEVVPKSGVFYHTLEEKRGNEIGYNVLCKDKDLSEFNEEVYNIVENEEQGRYNVLDHSNHRNSTQHHNTSNSSGYAVVRH